MNADDILFAPIGSKQDIKIPVSWIAVLQALQRQPTWMCSALAGGALRDLELGRSVKDVDIFVPHTGNARNLIKDALRDLHDPNLLEVEHSGFNTSQLGQEGISHFLFQQDGWKFEVSQKIEAFDYMNLLDSFDIGLCMISFDGSNIYRTEEYKRDKQNKTITIIRPTGGREMDHAERILRKYHGWKIVPL